VEFEKEAIEWINGELLGDGRLELITSGSVRFRYSSKYFEYIEYVKNMINSFGINGKKIYKYRRTNKSYDYKYASRSHKELLHLCNKWYPSGKKIVPKDIELTPLTCRQWYIGDGCLRCQGKRNPHIIIYTDGFSIPDIDLLLKKLTNLGFKVARQIHHHNKWIIYISSYSTKEFLNYIGECPVKRYEYKFDYKGIKNKTKEDKTVLK
jgi:hypothetical protein